MFISGIKNAQKDLCVEKKDASLEEIAKREENFMKLSFETISSLRK